MTTTRFFDEVAAVGDELLQHLQGRGNARQFLLRVRDVYQLLVEIHDDIVTAAVEVEAATTLDKGRSAVRALRHDSLEAVFRARRWCDELQSLGNDLQFTPAGTLPPSHTWDSFTQSLREREGEVAMLYETSMRDVIQLAGTIGSLSELQAFMSQVSEELIVQKSRFDYLAKRAAALARAQ